MGNSLKRSMLSKKNSFTSYQNKKVNFFNKPI